MRVNIREIVLIAFFAALTSVLAYVSVPLPFFPVPITGQTLAVMLAGVLLGPVNGALSQVVYVMLGAVGLPVFSPASGLTGAGALFGPTGGFIWGFILGAFVTGKAVEMLGRPQNMARLMIAMFVGGVLAVYLPGIIQVSAVTGIPPSKAMFSMLPYLPGDLIKAWLGALLAKKMLPVFR